MTSYPFLKSEATSLPLGPNAIALTILSRSTKASSSILLGLNLWRSLAHC
ncbi:MAG: hypothetical protein HC847_17325 [Hydrococcus sp. RU_2_2]|nr:hypothetical protein [Hydrococcus sp. RU_2_2]